MLLSAGLAAWPATALAQDTGGWLSSEPTVQAEPAADPSQAAAEVLAADEFGHVELQTRWRLQNPEPEPDVPDAAWSAVPGAAIEVLMWAALGVLVAMSVLWLLRRREPGGARPGRRPALPPAVVGLDAAPGAMPSDPAAAARALVADGRLDAALGPLYRGAVRWLVDQAGAELPIGATERECLAAARGALDGGPSLDAFTVLTRTWQRAAYAHAPPPADDVLALCDRWPASFGGRP